MSSGIELLNRVDEVINETSSSRRQFALDTDINPSTMATWKTKNIFPTAETLILIAEKLDVTIDWLVNGSILSEAELKKRDDIRKRIYDLATYTEEERNQINWGRTLKFENYSTTHHELSKIRQTISYKKLLNWSKGRCEINSVIFERIANRLNVSVDQLINDTDSESNSDNNLLFVAQKNEYTLLTFNKLSTKNKEKIKDYINDLYKLQQLEERDSE